MANQHPVPDGGMRTPVTRRGILSMAGVASAAAVAPAASAAASTTGAPTPTGATPSAVGGSFTYDGVKVRPYQERVQSVMAGSFTRIYDAAAGRSVAWHVNDHTLIKGSRRDVAHVRDRIPGERRDGRAVPEPRDRTEAEGSLHHAGTGPDG